MIEYSPDTKENETEDSRVHDIYSCYLSYKNYRANTGWDANALKSVRFYFGDQWSKDDKWQLELQNRAPAVFNMILPAIDLIIGHHIQNIVDIVAKPVDQFADPYIASIITTVIKHFEQSNGIEHERRQQFIDGVMTGIGVKELYYDTETSIDGKLVVRQQPPWDFFLDPNFTKYDYSDATKLIRVKWMSAPEIKRIYGKKVAKEVNASFYGDNIEYFPENIVNATWDAHSDDYGNRKDGGYDKIVDMDEFVLRMGYDKNKKTVRVIEQYERIWEEVEYYFDPMTNTWERADALSEEEYLLVKNQTIKRNVPHIHLTTLAGGILANDEDLDAKEFYQLFNFFFPYFFNGKYMGLIENLFYPQEEINKRHSQMVHILSSMSNTGILYEEGAFDANDVEDVKLQIAKNGQLIKMADMYDEAGHKLYEIIQPHGAPADYTRLKAEEKDDVKFISGAHDAIAGISTREESGKAKDLQIRQSQVRLLGIIDNFRNTQKLEGKAYVWWIQAYYNEERIVRIMGKLGMSDEEITLNKEAMGQIFNDVTVGEYDITLEYEGKTSSERERLFWKFVETANVLPQYADIIAEVALDFVDFPQKDLMKQKWIQRTQMIQQQQQMQMAQGIMPPPAGGRGPVQSAPRPERGARREPQRLQG